MITDSSGATLSARDYNPFGETIREYNSASITNRYKFTEKERDAETNFDYFGARYYDSELGRWLSVDPMADKAPGINPFHYCFNNPLLLRDSDGEWPWVANANTSVLGNLRQNFSGAVAVAYTKEQMNNINHGQFETAVNRIKEQAPGIGQLIENTKIPVVIMENLGSGTLGAAIQGETGAVIAANILENSGDLAKVLLHETVHMLGGDESGAWAATIAAGLYSGTAYMNDLATSNTGRLEYLTAGMPQKLKEKINAYRKAQGKEKERLGQEILNEVEATGNEIIRYSGN